MADCDTRGKMIGVSDVDEASIDLLNEVRKRAAHS